MAALLLVFVVYGWYSDRSYILAGGRHPTRRDHIFLFSTVAAFFILSVFLAAIGARASELGSLWAVVLLLLGSLWYLGRLRVRRKYPPVRYK